MNYKIINQINVVIVGRFVEYQFSFGAKKKRPKEKVVGKTDENLIFQKGLSYTATSSNKCQKYGSDSFGWSIPLII